MLGANLRVEACRRSGRPQTRSKAPGRQTLRPTLARGLTWETTTAYGQTGDAMAEEKGARKVLRAHLKQRADAGATVEELERDLAEEEKHDGKLSAEDYEELRFYAWALVEQAHTRLISERSRESERDSRQ
jgi:hypothetical protein